MYVGHIMAHSQKLTGRFLEEKGYHDLVIILFNIYKAQYP